MKLFQIVVIVLFLIVYNQIVSEAQLIKYVNPFIGASTSMKKARDAAGLGKTFPGATTPFGMVQVSPNTITGGDNGNGYTYEDEFIEGFAFTQMSGIGWYGDLGNFLVTPATGKLQVVAGRHPELGKGYRSRFSKKDEVAAPGYYAASLTDCKVRAEATVAPHSGILRFTFPSGNQSRIQIDLARRVGGTSTLQYIKVIDPYTIQGWMKCTPEGGGWGNGDGKPDYTVYFYAQFSRPMEKYGVWSAKIPDNQRRKRQEIESLHYDSIVAGSAIIPYCKEIEGRHLGFYTEFETKEGEIVCLKSGISFASIEGAKLNLEKEIPEMDFEKVRQQAEALWNEQLSKIIITGGTEDQKTVFYTAMYHTMIDPRNMTDLNGDYPGGDRKIHRTDQYTRRTVFSGWDVFRSQFPLQTIINPLLVSDMISSLTDLAEESGNRYLERWEFLNAYSGCMVGNPAISVLADAYNKGIRNFNVDKAYLFARNTSEKFGNNGIDPSTGISTTLEHAYTEWCMSQLADSLHHPEDVILFSKRSKAYREVYDPELKSFRPKNKDGSWKPWPKKGQLAMDYGCAESNPYQQGWFVPHDLDGLIRLKGGLKSTQDDLISFFDHTPLSFNWNEYYNHANEPVHLIPFMFNRLKMPWKTQFWVRTICENAYFNKVEGLVGNEDVGQMSAWYILASSGLHQACPGDNRYEIFSPVFDKVQIQTPATSKTFTIVSRNNSKENKYIQSATLNGKPYNKCFIYHQTILEGGVLEFDLGPQPNEKWGVE